MLPKCLNGRSTFFNSGGRGMWRHFRTIVLKERPDISPISHIHDLNFSVTSITIRFPALSMNHLRTDRLFVCRFNLFRNKVEPPFANSTTHVSLELRTEKDKYRLWSSLAADDSRDPKHEALRAATRTRLRTLPHPDWRGKAAKPHLGFLACIMSRPM
jgi:hypothetical protein